jgi:hypothetical protein
MWNYPEEHVQRQGICQQNRSNIRPKEPSLQSITSETNAKPFQLTTMDFIVKSLLSQGHGSIFAITNNDCTKAAILLPYKETINALEITTLFKEQVFPFIEIPQKAITDKDTHLTCCSTKDYAIN